MIEKNSITKEKQNKNKRTETKAVGSVRKVYKVTGQEYMFHVWKNSDGQWDACWTFYPQKRRGLNFILQRGKLQSAMLQLQHKSGWKSVYIWPEVGGRKSKRTLRSQTKKR
jgi:hypothetical protein